MNNMNNMNNIFNNHNMNNMNNMNINMNNNFNNHNMNIINNMNNMNNINNMMMPNFNNNIFNGNQFWEKSQYLEIMNLDDNYFIIGSLKYIKKDFNNIKSYFYLSLFSYDTLEEISKIEIDVIEIPQNLSEPYYCNFTMKFDNNNISIHINTSLINNDYNYEFKNSEIIST